MRITLKTRDGLVVAENVFHAAEDVRVEVLLPSWLHWLRLSVVVRVASGMNNAVITVKT
jgi:hypothetical protein